MKLLNWIKNLFNTQEKEAFADGVYCGEVRRDIFGDIIQPFEYVYPILYCDVKRRGYVTVRADAVGYAPNELTDEMLKRGVIRARRFVGGLCNNRVKAGKRKDFYHYYCTPEELKIAQ